MRGMYHCIVGYNEFDFFWKIKNTDPLMGEKFKSKTQLQLDIKNTEFHADFKSVEKG
jgi:hypothetical protein